jgi:4-hydroxybenzoate polyprenyltransferase
MMKAVGFIIHSNILLALAAVALTLASQVQLGIKPQPNAYLAVIFFSTLLDYNFHRLRAVSTNPEAFGIGKLKWSFGHLKLIKLLIILAFTGFVFSLIYTGFEILYLLLPLAFLSLLYSFTYTGKRKQNFSLLRISGMKTMLIAFIWTTATVFVPVLQYESYINFPNILLLCAERFTFIFAIAIPFDIRDVETDRLSSLKTIPIHFGESNAIKISNIALLLSLSIAGFHFYNSKMIFILPAYALSILITLIFINYKPLRNVAFYYHGILDGCIFLYGMLIFVSFYLQSVF